MVKGHPEWTPSTLWQSGFVCVTVKRAPFIWAAGETVWWCLLDGVFFSGREKTKREREVFVFQSALNYVMLESLSSSTRRGVDGGLNPPYNPHPSTLTPFSNHSLWRMDLSVCVTHSGIVFKEEKVLSYVTWPIQTSRISQVCNQFHSICATDMSHDIMFICCYVEGRCADFCANSR